MRRISKLWSSPLYPLTFSVKFVHQSLFCSPSCTRRLSFCFHKIILFEYWTTYVIIILYSAVRVAFKSFLKFFVLVKVLKLELGLYITQILYIVCSKRFLTLFFCPSLSPPVLDLRDLFTRFVYMFRHVDMMTKNCRVRFSQETMIMVSWFSW